MNSKKEYPKQQHCPVCNRYVRDSIRYPNYACAKCVLKAVDDKGRAVSFFNVTMDGHGCQGILVETKDLVNSKHCFIQGIRFEAEEGYLGGIVLLPEVKKKRVKKKKV
ncbi:hypothetical protein D3C87_148420 [compost metagenome]